MVLQVQPYKNNCNFVFVLKFLTYWWMNLHFYNKLYHKTPIVHDLLPSQTQVETQYVKFNVTPDKIIMVTFAFNFGQ